jgi:hypothetical protein
MAERGRVPGALRLCRGCHQFVLPAAVTCRFCGGDLDALERAYQDGQSAIRRAADALKAAMAERGIGIGG